MPVSQSDPLSVETSADAFASTGIPALPSASSIRSRVLAMSWLPRIAQVPYLAVSAMSANELIEGSMKRGDSET